ncbi:hypothetical protein PoB_003193700 [Plakobranchus ocellatus]|uniref:Uncharacterized protein n=1 Tax=Plakobranchus ocellatus TaxID=259542 RepID=A0AAV4AEL3_9GAST|nr:hypothetical protein PoB_003193700 [Plakobranchus ocellatus]
MIGCAGVVARVVWSKKFPTNRYAQPDNRQQFLIQLAKEVVFDQVKRRAVAVKTMNLPYRINLETVLDSLSASCDQSGASSKRQAMSSASKKTLQRAQHSPIQNLQLHRKPSVNAHHHHPPPRESDANKKRPKNKNAMLKMHKYVCGEHSSFICTVCNSK